MQRGGGGGRKKPCGFMGVHKQAAGRQRGGEGYGRESRSRLVRAISFTPSFLFKHKTWSRVAAHESGREAIYGLGSSSNSAGGAGTPLLNKAAQFFQSLLTDL